MRYKTPRRGMVKALLIYRWRDTLNSLKPNPWNGPALATLLTSVPSFTRLTRKIVAELTDYVLTAIEETSTSVKASCNDTRRLAAAASTLPQEHHRLIREALVVAIYLSIPKSLTTITASDKNGTHQRLTLHLALQM